MKNLSTEEKKTKWDKIHEIGDRCLLELLDSYDKFPDFNSAHEGYAVLLEEVDELWEEVKKNPKELDKLKAEAIQVSAMAMKLIYHVQKSENRTNNS